MLVPSLEVLILFIGVLLCKVEYDLVVFSCEECTLLSISIFWPCLDYDLHGVSTHIQNIDCLLSSYEDIGPIGGVEAWQRTHPILLDVGSIRVFDFSHNAPVFTNQHACGLHTDEYLIFFKL